MYSRASIRICKQKSSTKAAACATPSRCLTPTLTSLNKHFNAIAAHIQNTDFRWTEAPNLRNRVYLESSATLPRQPDGSKWITYAALGLAAGLAVALLGISVLRYTRSTLRLAACGLIGAWLGIGCSFLIPEQYTSSASVLAHPPEVASAHETAPTAQAVLDGLTKEIFDVQGIASIAASGKYPFFRRWPGLDSLEIARRIKKNLTLERSQIPTLGISCLRLYFTDRDARVAQSVVRELITRLEERNYLYHQTRAREEFPRLAASQSATLPESPDAPNRLLFALAGLAAGALAGTLTRPKRRTSFAPRREAPLLLYS
jgi:hypothetical protein